MQFIWFSGLASDQCHRAAAPCSLGVWGDFFETGGRPEANPSTQAQRPKELAMKTFRDDAATALVTVTFAIATVSTFLVVFLGAV